VNRVTGTSGLPLVADSVIEDILARDAFGLLGISRSARPGSPQVRPPEEGRGT
jgi:hypothetical protein